jgi:hypothetical protein
MSAARGNRVEIAIIARMQLGTAVGLCIYWLIFFTIGMAPERPPVGYFVFQHRFTVPDIILAVALIRAATWLLSRDAGSRRHGLSLSLLCSGALLFLGALDICFNILNDVYLVLSLDTITETAVNAWCIGFGLLSARECAAAVLTSEHR